MASDRAIGVISVQSYERNVFNPDHVRILQIFGASRGAALENARLFKERQTLVDETKERNAELGFVNSLQEALSKGLEAQQIYEVIGEKMHEIFDAHVLDIGLFNAQDRLVHFPYTIERCVRFPDVPMPLVVFRKHFMEAGEYLLIVDDM